MAKRRSPKPRPAEAVAVRGSEPHRNQAPMDRITVALIAIGLLVTAYLTGVAVWGEAPAFCAEGSGCDVVQSSAWSRLLGLPIALWGFALYALMGAIALRRSTRLKRWRRMFTLSLLGSVFSLYLTLVGIVLLDAVCWWCLASLLVICAIFVRTMMLRPDSAPGLQTSWRNWLLNHGIVAAAMVVLAHVWFAGLLQPPEDPRLSALATHLEESGALFYGAEWCPTCREQKRLFGRSADRLPYVECSPGGRTGAVAFACVSAGIEGYPTWEIRGRRYQQVMQPDELAQRSGFRWPQAGTDAE